MKRLTKLLWPALLGAVSLAVTGWLWMHERQAQDQHLKSNFDVGLRQAATGIEQRLLSYEQTLRGVRGLFDASDAVTRRDFDAYVDAQLVGPDIAGLRAVGYAPRLAADQVAAHVDAQRRDGAYGFAIRPPGERTFIAPVTYTAPAIPSNIGALGFDLLSEPVRRAAMLRAQTSGSAALTDQVLLLDAPGREPTPGFVMFMPLYAPGSAGAPPAERRARITGWVQVAFRITEMMSTLYGEGTPGLEIRVYDGTGVDAKRLMYPSVTTALTAARFEAQEFITFAGHTWTLTARSTPDFERQYSNDSPRVILIAGGVLSLLLALVAWQLATARDRATATAHEMTRQLRDGAEQYRRIVETANEGIWVVDAQARTTFVNPKLVQLFGYTADEMIGRRWFDFIDRAGATALMREADAGQQPGASLTLSDARFRRKDGTDLWLSLSTSPAVDALGQRAGVLAMATDITGRKLAESNRVALELQLRQSQKMEAIGTLAGGIAHDFNNILAAILGNAAILDQELDPRHPARGRIEQIGKAGVRARSLVRQIVTFARQQPQQLRPQPLRPLLEESIELLRSTLPTLVQIESWLSDAPLRVDADATQLQQVVMNLCTNAWHALQGRAGRIIVGLEPVTLDHAAATRLGLRPGAHAHVWVSDNGSGMDDATRARIFEPFFTTKSVGVGTGLGLSVAHGIVSAHGGVIDVISTPGQGSTFDLYFPLSTAVASVPTEPAAPAAEPPVVRGHGEHVLYVDDDEVVLVVVEALLQRWGYRATCLTDPRDALERLRAEPAAFDVVVSDFNMPGLSGLDVAIEVARIRPDLPVVISSGYVSDAMQEALRRAGVRHVLQKELTLEHLGEMVERALAGEAEPQTHVLG